MKSIYVIQELKKFSSFKKAKTSAWFFKTGKGQYGAGDVFIGVTVPEQRVVAKKFADLPLPEILKLLQSKVHEHRLTGLIILVEQYKKGNEKEKAAIIKFYIKNRKYVNNWDLVDSSARYILGDWLLKRDRKILYTLARSKNIWDRRIAIVATHAFIVKGDFADTIKISLLLADDSHDLIHKAVGWMLRELGKRDRKTLVKFLSSHRSKLPRTALRYAIEHFSPRERTLYLKR